MFRGLVPRCGLLAWRGGNHLDFLLLRFLGFPVASLLTVGHVNLPWVRLQPQATYHPAADRKDLSLKIVMRRGQGRQGGSMKFVERGRYADPDTAARKLIEIANGVGAVQDRRIYIERANGNEPISTIGATLMSWESSASTVSKGSPSMPSHCCIRTMPNRASASSIAGGLRAVA
jgi:hypothetical protein